MTARKQVEVNYLMDKTVKTRLLLLLLMILIERKQHKYDLCAEQAYKVKY